MKNISAVNHAANETFLNRKYRNISYEGWAIFQSRALHYEEPATDLLMKLIKVEILRYEKNRVHYKIPKAVSARIVR